MASEKHFAGKYNKAEMSNLAADVIKNVSHIGVSDRANPGRTTAKILWGTYEGVLYGMIIDSDKLKKNVVEIVSFYDVHCVEKKIKRFNMKKVSKG